MELSAWKDDEIPKGRGGQWDLKNVTFDFQVADFLADPVSFHSTQGFADLIKAGSILNQVSRVESEQKQVNR